MNIGKLIYSMVVASDATLVGLIGTRIYPEEAPNSVTYPYITFSKVRTESNKAKNIVSPLDMIKVTFFIYSNNYDTSENVAIALRNNLII
jgi:adenine C2-methylase RlmN of 23S rRNA A2503 and tRNA A37